MPRAGQVRVEPGRRLSDRVALGVLTATFPRRLVDDVIEATGRREQRTRLLPAHLTLYYVLAMTLFSSAGYEEVMASLTEGLAWSADGEVDYEAPSQVAITKARARLGPEPLELLFDRACVPLATPGDAGAFYRDWRLVSMDGTTVDVADTAANAGVLGRAGTGRGDGSAFPQLRIVALGECGTHAVIAARMGSYDVGEVTLAKRLVSSLRPGMLCLADHGFTAFPLWDKVSATGADLLWRAKTNAVLPVLARYGDGSFRSELVASTDKYARDNPIPVRVIEYAINDEGRPGTRNTTYRLVTTILDPADAAADELAALYAQRWEIESIFDELKTHQRRPRVVLRSRTPEGVYQEAWGYLCVHYALRALIHAAADHGDLDPDRISFTKALHAARRSVRTGVGGALTLAVTLQPRHHRVTALTAPQAPVTRQRPRRETQDEQLQPQTRGAPRLAPADPSRHRRGTHPQPTSSYRY